MRRPGRFLLAPAPTAPNSLPLTQRQVRALARAATRELCWGLRAVSQEVARWRRHAETIPDPLLRQDALHALDCKRGHTDGAALFWTLPSQRNLNLLRLLVTFEVIYDYLDNVSEREAVTTGCDAHLFRALVDALTPGAGIGDYYRDSSRCDDGGYLRTLVGECQAGCAALPSFRIVRPYIALEAGRTAVLAINHVPDPRQRDAALRAWSRHRFAQDVDLRWWEWTAAASQSVVTFALLAVAAEKAVSPIDAQATYNGYFPWFAYAVTMLDSYVDQEQDLAADAHSYIAHYTELDAAIRRLCESIDRSAERLLSLVNGERHAVLLGCMIALYLSKDGARAGNLQDPSQRLVQAGGSLTRVLLPILRTWRLLNGQTATT